MKKIILARHGEGQGGHKKLIQSKEDLLTEQGIRQARDLAAYVKEKEISTILTSPSFRTLQTATIVGAECGVSVSTMKELGEIDFGQMTGKPAGNLTIEEAMELGGGEKPHEVFERVKVGWEKINHLEWDGAMLVVTHRSILSAIDTVIKKGKVNDFLRARKKNHELNFGYWKEIVI